MAETTTDISLKLFKTGDYEDAADAASSGALYPVNIPDDDFTPSTLENTLSTIQQVANFFGYSSNESEVVLDVNGKYYTMEEIDDLADGEHWDNLHGLLQILNAPTL